MPGQDTLQRVADLLPQDRREAFFACVARFKDVPEEDEYLQILEAIGFMTMIWSDVPNQVKAVLEAANPVTDTCQSVGSQLASAVKEAIPSYDDLRQVTTALEQHQLALRQTLAAVQKPTEFRHSFITLTLVFLAGIAADRWLVPIIFSDPASRLSKPLLESFGP